ncbi:MAG: hypothetical protein JNM93_08785 [Bacteriovoracaceae bacterium]|nr:hypothetical protein [Bacteriovoracaceae bacterium]
MKFIILILLFSCLSCSRNTLKGALDGYENNRASTERGESGVGYYERTRNTQNYRNYKENEEAEQKKKSNLLSN